MTGVKKATSTDLDAVVAIENDCFADDRFSRRQLGYLITKAQGACFIISQNNSVKAYISVIYKKNTSNLRIYSIAVLPEARGRGFGQMLIDKSKTFAREQHCSKITLEVKTTNAGALALYKKNGFQINGIIPNYYHDGTAAYHMILNLK